MNKGRKTEARVSGEIKPDKNVVQSLAKGFQVLQAFTSEEPELVLAEIARRTGLDKGTTFRLLNTLVMLSYVEKVDVTRRFRLSLKWLDELGYKECWIGEHHTAPWEPHP